MISGWGLHSGAGDEKRTNKNRKQFADARIC